MSTTLVEELQKRVTKHPLYECPPYSRPGSEFLKKFPQDYREHVTAFRLAEDKSSGYIDLIFWMLYSMSSQLFIPSL